MSVKKKIRAYRLPIDEGSLDAVLNNDNVSIIDKKYVTDVKTGEVTVILEYEEIIED